MLLGAELAYGAAECLADFGGVAAHGAARLSTHGRPVLTL
jgi:hypothetical protein